MTRVKEYQRDEVLAAATEIFWEKGYEATSISDLVEATGVHRRSMYSEFEGKEGLFLACIELFGHQRLKVTSEAEEQFEPGLPAIEGFFALGSKDVLDELESGCAKGCLLTNSIVENRSLGEQVNQRVEAHFDRLEEWFAKMFEIARKQGQVPKKRKAEELAKYLRIFLTGLALNVRSNCDPKALQTSMQIMLETIRK